MDRAIIDRQATAAPARRLLFIGTGGVVADVGRAIELRDEQLLPPTELQGQTTIVLDLGVATLTPGPLRELIVPLGQRIKGGVYGNARLIIATTDLALAELIGLLADTYELPLYIAKSSEERHVSEAMPAGSLTPTERDTLATVIALGGRTTAVSLAEQIGIEPTAVNNRLANIYRKGYLYRYERPRRMGDVYIDPRMTPEAAQMDPHADTSRGHEAETDPYGRSPLRLEGDAARRAAELVETRTGRKRDR
jgi:DNA-binding CsgD family transcriptional regulator